ncbi:MAG TPA: hypothetical protein VKE42_11155 [Candidatus Cybelea sp.]|nr:hypothetical protein [Candidatus Cybelea sp.]
MTARRHPDDDDDDYVLKDGERVRVPMLVRDSATTAIDYCSTDPLAAHRPGFRRAADAGVRDASERAYREMVARSTGEWRTPQRVEQDREAACVAARDEVLSMGDAQAIRDRAWFEMCERARNAWKTA